MRHNLAFLLLLVLTVSNLESQNQKAEATGSHICRTIEVPTSWAFDNPPVRIEANQVSFSEIGWVTLSLRVLNEESTPIQALTMIVEYLDVQGEPIIRVPIFAHIDRAIAKGPPDMLKPAQAWKSALSPGEEAVLAGDSMGIRTGGCPARSRVTFVREEFTNSRVRTSASSNWQLGPSPALVPILPDSLPDLPVEAPASLLAKLRISDSGSVIDVVPQVAADSALLQWIRARMKQGWRFYPALINGRPVESELNVLFQIHAKGMARFPETQPLPKPVTLIRFVWSHDAFPKGDGSDRLMLMYGVLTEGSAPEFPAPGIYSPVSSNLAR